MVASLPHSLAFLLSAFPWQTTRAWIHQYRKLGSKTSQSSPLSTATITTRRMMISPSTVSDTPPHRPTVLDSRSPLSLTIEELSELLQGTGRARAVWEYYRDGLDPLLVMDEDTTTLPNNFKHTAPLGAQTRRVLRHTFQPLHSIASVVNYTVSSDGTTKLLLRLADQLEVESVIIPWDDRQSSTLCVSCQVGCRQACTFCLTGRMGKLRSLTADEILVQVVAAIHHCRTHSNNLYQIDNIVFMGQGDAADNVHAVVRAANILTDQFCFAPKRITISTVAPTPDAFSELGGPTKVALAWSVHSSRDEIRKRLVPTAKFAMTELRDALIEALLQRTKSQRAIMLEVTLLEGINDSLEDAHHLAEFCYPFFDRIPGLKLVVNLIPWNDISVTSGPASQYRTPSRDRVLTFQQELVRRGILCYMRVTRGDDKSAACGQLATRTLNALGQRLGAA